MSCYQVNKDTLDLLASASQWTDRQIYSRFAPETERLNTLVDKYEDGENVLRTHGTEIGTIQAIGEELLRANVKSVLARYNDGAEMIGYDTYTAEPILRWQNIATIEDVLGAISCYEYQSCESEDWRNSWASEYCNALRKNLCALLSEDKWEYERPTDSAKLVRIIQLVNLQPVFKRHGLGVGYLAITERPFKQGER